MYCMMCVCIPLIVTNLQFQRSTPANLQKPKWSRPREKVLQAIEKRMNQRAEMMGPAPISEIVNDLNPSILIIVATVLDRFQQRFCMTFYKDNLKVSICKEEIGLRKSHSWPDIFKRSSGNTARFHKRSCSIDISVTTHSELREHMKFLLFFIIKLFIDLFVSIYLL